MREKLKSLPLTELKQIAKENHIKNVSTLRKAQLIDVILERLSPEQAQTPQTKMFKHLIYGFIRQRTCIGIF